MTTDRLADLQKRLSDAAAGQLASVAFDGLAAAWPPTEAPFVPDPDLAVSFDKAMSLIGRLLPGWGVALDGTASAVGPWTCRVRSTGLRDDDEVIGIGKAETAPLAMIVALLQVLIIRSTDHA